MFYILIINNNHEDLENNKHHLLTLYVISVCYLFASGKNVGGINGCVRLVSPSWFAFLFYSLKTVNPDI